MTPVQRQSFQVLVAELLEGCIMFGLILGATARIHYALRGLMPTNVLLDALHTRRGLKWGMPAMLLAVPYALAAVFCSGQAEAGGSGWFNLLALVFAWNALKFLVVGPMTLMRLLWVLAREANVRRQASRAILRDGIGPERLAEPELASQRG